MSARIALEPVSSSLAGYGLRAASPGTTDASKVPKADVPQRAQAGPSTAPPADDPGIAESFGLDPLPAPPLPPGAAFAVALISGQLAPAPTSEVEIQMRLGSAELPSHGSLALHDRLV